MQQDSLDRTRREMVAERAAALARITLTLQRQLERLEQMRLQIPETRGAKRAKHLAAYEALRDKAEIWRWYLRVQREVNGLYDGDTLEERFPIPGPLAD